jgi:putative PIN family toxin of toxin-antitoxin system
VQTGAVMLRNIVDTNVLVSALIQKSFPYLIIYHHFINGEFELCVSDELIAEYYDVLQRPKFQKFHDFYIKAESLLSSIESRAVKYQSDKAIQLIADEADNRLLEIADSSNADYIITGNTNHFNFARFQHTRIVTPKQYWEEHGFPSLSAI